jgi:hypothetical protein
MESPLSASSGSLKIFWHRLLKHCSSSKVQTSFGEYLVRSVWDVRNIVEPISQDRHRLYQKFTSTSGAEVLFGQAPNAQKQTSVLGNPEIAEAESISTIGQIFIFENNIASSLRSVICGVPKGSATLDGIPDLVHSHRIRIDVDPLSSLGSPDIASRSRHCSLNPLHPGRRAEVCHRCAEEYPWFKAR